MKTDEFTKALGFKMEPWQKERVDAIEAGKRPVFFGGKRLGQASIKRLLRERYGREGIK